ncbi:MFS transporter [Natronomonas pharaonis]|nr:MFS transporter [Natronomonas pharaonis]
MDRPGRATLWVIVASATLTVMAGAILGPVVPGIQDGLDITESQAGLVITTHAAFIVLASPLAGAAIDRFGPRRPYAFGLGIYAVGGGAGLGIDAYVPLLASRAVLGVGVAFVHTGITVLIYEYYTGQAMDRALGLRTGANSVGAAVWPLVGGALGVIAWQVPFAVYLVAAPLGVAALLVLPEPLDAASSEAAGGDASTAATSDDAPATVDDDNDNTPATASGVVGVFASRPSLLAVYLLYGAANALLYAIVVFYPQLLETLGVASALGISLYLSANGVAGGIAGASYDRLKQATGSLWLVAVAFLLWTIGFGTAAVVESPAAAFLPVVLFGIGLGLVFPSSFVWVERLAPTDRQGQFGSYVAMAGYIGQFSAPVVFGPLVAPFGVRAVFSAAALAAVGGLAAVGVALWRSNQ